MFTRPNALLLICLGFLFQIVETDSSKVDVIADIHGQATEEIATSFLKVGKSDDGILFSSKRLSDGSSVVLIAPIDAAARRKWRSSLRETPSNKVMEELRSEHQRICEEFGLAYNIFALERDGKLSNLER